MLCVRIDTSNHLQQQQHQQQQLHTHSHSHPQQQQQQQHLHMHLHGQGLHNMTAAAHQLQMDPSASNNSSSSLSNTSHSQSQQYLANATTLANLKKQRSLSRSSVLNNCENGSVLGTANSTSHNHHYPHNPSNNNNNNSSNALDHQVNTQQPLANNGLQHPALMDYNGLIHDPSSQASATAAGSTRAGGAGGVNKFSGITGDVVSDSTSSKKCCTLM